MIHGLPFYLQELKLKYYKLMIELCRHDQKYLAICQHYRAIFDTPQVQKEEGLWKEVGGVLVGGGSPRTHKSMFVWNLSIVNIIGTIEISLYGGFLEIILWRP